MKKKAKGGLFKTSSGDRFSKTAPKTRNFAKHLERKAKLKSY